MSGIKKILTIEVKERFEIFAIDGAEFANRLRVNTDAKKGNLFSRVQSEFWGKVNSDSFEINNYKRKGIIIRGSMQEEKDKLIVSLVYVRKNVAIPLVLFYCCLSAIAISDHEWAFLLFITLFVILFIVGGRWIANTNIKEISETIKMFLEDKEIRELSGF